MTRRTALARELRRLRIERGLQPLELAQLAGVDERTVDSIESNGNVAKVGTIERLAAALETDPAPLLELRETAMRNKPRLAARRELRTVWRVVGLPDPRWKPDLQLVVDTDAEPVVEAIEAAAAAHGIKLERQ